MSKKVLMFLCVVVLFALVRSPTAQAGFFDRFLDLSAGRISGVILAVRYSGEMAACQIEVRHLQDQTNILWNRYYEENRRYYDLRRELNDCRHDGSDLWIDIEECEAALVDASSSEDSEVSDSSSANSDTDFAIGVDSRIVVRVTDLLINGTCEEPKTDRKRRECLDNCHRQLEWYREDLVEVQERVENVEESMREDIRMCREDVAYLETRIADCRDGQANPSPDSGEPEDSAEVQPDDGGPTEGEDEPVSTPVQFPPAPIPAGPSCDSDVNC